MILITGALLVSRDFLKLCAIEAIVAAQIIPETNEQLFQVDEEQRPMNYSQAFQLMPDGAGSYFIFNDVFKLVFG